MCVCICVYMMAAPNMATITASLERSFQNFSLNNHTNNSSTTTTTQHQNDNDETTLELNSHVSLPYNWEQCLDLKTGEIYYINWRNGMKAKEDPRTQATTTSNTSPRDSYYTEEDDDDDEEEEEEEESSCESGESSSESSAANSKKSPEEVLVVVGCKTCFMYFMLPKHVTDCPKCCANLLHFDRSQNASL